MKKLLVLLLALVMCVATFVACGEPDEPEVTYKLDQAVAYVKNLYLSEQVKPEGSDVGVATKYADFERVSSVPIAGVMYDVVWSVSETDETKVKVVQGSGTTPTVIDVNEKTEEDISFTLTATVKAGDGSSKTITFNIFVPKYDVMTYEEYRATNTGDSATIEGIVVALNSKSAGNKRNHIFVVDAAGKGGYYAYDMADDPAKLGIEVGMTVAISGTVEVYQGMHEIKEGIARITNSEKVTPAAIDVSAKFGAGESILEYVGALITIKGVTIGGQDLATANSQYLYFTLNGNESYIRTYVTDLPTSFDVTTDELGNTVCADKAIIDAAHAEKRDWTANVTGVLIAYNGTPYLMPIDKDCFEYLQFVQKTSEEKVDAELDEIKVPAIINKDGELALPLVGTIYSDIQLSWASNSEAAVIGEGKVTFTIPDTATDIKLTVTLTCGDATKSKEFTIKLTKQLDPNTFVTIPEANTMGAAQEHNTYTEGKYFVTGVIDSIVSDRYGNINIKDSEGNNLYIYGLYSVDGKLRFDAMETKPAVGDTITVYGSVGQYNGTAQMKNAWLVAVPAADSELSIVGANVIGLAQGHNKYTEGKYVVTGVIDSIDSTKYGNMTIIDAEGNTFYLYGLYSADGEIRFDAMETKPAVGDTITVSGIVGQYSGTAQIKNAWMTAHTAATPDEGGDDNTGTEGGDTPTLPEANSNVTIADAIALGSAMESDSYTEGKYYVTGVITEVYNTKYGNMKITDDKGNILTVYGTYDATGATRYDALEVKPVAGDTVTVYGVIGQYNGTPQVKNGWITAHIAATPDEGGNGDTTASESAKITFDDKAKRTVYTTEQQVWVENGVTVTNDKGESTSNVGDYANPLRLYQNSNVTISSDRAMNKIVILCNSGKPIAGLTAALDAAGATYTAEGNTVTITLAAPATSFAVTGLTAQVRFDSVTVYYAA